MITAGESNRTAPMVALRRGRPRMVARTVTTVVATTALALLAAGCGSEQPSLGTGLVETTTTIAPTTTSTTEPTTTIDFDRPIEQGVEPLADDAGPDEIRILVDEIRGQTTNIAVQVERLAPFPGLAGPAVAQIMDLTVIHGPEVDDEYPSRARVRYRTPEDAAAMVKAISDELRAQSWNKIEETVTPTDDGEVTDLMFLISGNKPEELELRATIEATPEATVIELDYFVLADQDEAEAGEDVTYFDLLSAWQDVLPLPRAAELVEVEVTTSDEIGTLVARYRLEAEDEAEAVAAVAAAVGSDGYELFGSTPDDPPSVGPLRVAADADGPIVVFEFAPASEDEVFDIEASIGFDLTPLD